MTTDSSVARLLLPLCAALALSGGCMSQKYSAEPYRAAQDRFGAIALATSKQVYVCPTIDSLAPECRKHLASKFTPWEHATDAIEKELQASGVQPVRPAFACGPSFDSLKQAVGEKAVKGEKAVYLGTELLWLAAGRWTLDAKLLDPTGKVLFEKRGICVVLGVPKVDAQEVTHMALRQILADPLFQQALAQ